MLFSSLEFLFGFLPIAYLIFRLALRTDIRIAEGAVVLGSLFFYAWWDWRNIWVIAVSICINYVLGNRILDAADRRHKRTWLIVGLTFNLLFLGWFKYAAWLSGLLQAENFRELTSVAEVASLPLGISFFTFQKIAFLVDCHNAPPRRRYNVIEYAFFVTFFPQLIAGPIVHHSDIIPQLWTLRRHVEGRHYVSRYVLPGMLLLTLGLFKKVVLADSFGDFANDSFGHVNEKVFGFLDAWSGALSYTFQIYFDFSGYSDMALGLASLFGVHLPPNFMSPYKSRSIIEFWRRWHMSLSRFLRDYLYFPLGGNRQGKFRRYLNLMVTMLLGGLWHGASLTFLFWGGLHGCYLILNHLWRRWMPIPLPPLLAFSLTFLAIVISWVPFRAANLADCFLMYKLMLGLDGIVLPWKYQFLTQGAFQPLAQWLGVRIDDVNHFAGLRQVAFFVAGALIAFRMPNSLELLHRPYRHRIFSSHLAPILLGVAFAFSLVILFTQENVTFLYFQF